MLCDHPRLWRETLDDVATGDYVCLRCGKAERNAGWVFRDRAANGRARSAAALRDRRERATS